MDKRILNILIGLGIAVIALIMINNFIVQQKNLIARLLEEGKAVKLVVATKDIPKENVITSEMVTLKTEPRASMQPGDLTSLDSVIGNFAVVDILKGQHINANMVRAQEAFKFLSQNIPSGMRAFTIPVDQISAIEGLIKPGDFVDIIATFRFPTGRERETLPVVVTLFQGVKVLATNRNISPYQISNKAGTITLALKPEDVGMLEYALQISSLRLVLRAPLDTTQEYEYTAVSFETLLKKIGMYTPPPTQERPSTVEIYKGASAKEEATLQ
ncbi:MAG: Flp pilus assembly protein CpaB [Candidatus Omnitrophica bacterium]|nr:Flp pilus assembly protein CpaB [Candidatus Omnitrophota bacterium]